MNEPVSTSRGRPTNTPGVRLSTMISVRFSVDEIAKLRRLAKSYDIPTSEFIRHYMKRVLASFDTNTSSVSQ